MIEITVIGTPGPQGSKRHVGHGVMVEMSTTVKPWRDSVAWAAREAMAGRAPLSGPVRVSMVFTLRKPKSAPKSRRTYPAVPPDLDKLARSTADALKTGGVYEDDSRIIGYSRLEKVFPNEDPEALDVPGVVIKVWRVESAFIAGPVKKPRRKAAA